MPEQAGYIVPTEFFLLALIPVFPLVGAAINGLFGAKLMAKFGPKANHLIAIAMPTISFLITLYALITLIGLDENARALYYNAFPFIHVGFFDADMAFWFDPLSATLTCIITFVGTLIHIYSVGYMKGDPSYWRFFTYLNLFLAMMLLLALGDNFLVMFIGWEGVGLCSYLLISFWYKEKANGIAGMKAFVVNRVGDFAFVIALGLLFWGLQGSYGGDFGRTESYRRGHVNTTPIAMAEQRVLQDQARGTYAGLDEIRKQQGPWPSSVRFDAIRVAVQNNAESLRADSPNTKTVWGVPLITLVCLLMFAAATGKSAQIPLFVWLPDAMAGPTPVSALIHAATMVTAGVYLIARTSFLYVLSPTAMTVVALVGAATALFAATIGLFQYDIKKVLAYSTVSQLGYMFMGVGVGAYWAGVYHLLTHAVFKACLFLGSGSVILGCHHEQDMRRMGGLAKYMPSTRWTYLIACMAITTAPFFFLANGFYSKDEILWKVFDATHLQLGSIPIPGWSLWIVGLIGAACTSFYMWRSYYMTFTGEYRGDTDGGHGHDDDDAHDDHGHHGGEPHESPKSMTYVLWTLAGLTFATIILGFFPLLASALGEESSLYHALHEPIFEHWLHPVVGAATESLPWLSKDVHAQYGPLTVHGWEFLLAGASILVTLGSWGMARMLYKDAKSDIPYKILTSANPLIRAPYHLIYNKYFVDELYDWAIVRRCRQLAGFFFGIDRLVIDNFVHLLAWLGQMVAQLDKQIDERLVDGAVNGTARVIGAAGQGLRQLQTGRIQSYLMGAMAGVIALIFINFVLF